MPAPSFASPSTGVFESAMCASGTRSEICQGTFTPGSSTHGKTRRAAIASNWENTYVAPACVSLNAP